MLGPAVTGIFQDNPGIIRFPVLADLLRAELGDRIGAPGRAEPEDVRLSSTRASPSTRSSENLVGAGLLTDTRSRSTTSS